MGAHGKASESARAASLSRLQSAVLSFQELKAGADFRRFAQHDGGRAVFVVAHGNGALNRCAGNGFAGHGEMHVDLGEDLGIDLGALGAELDGAAAHIMSAALEDQNHVIGRAAASASEQGFHGAGREVLPAVFGFGGIRRAVHIQDMAAAGLGHEAHP